MRILAAVPLMAACGVYVYFMWIGEHVPGWGLAFFSGSFAVYSFALALEQHHAGKSNRARVLFLCSGAWVLLTIVAAFQFF